MAANYLYLRATPELDKFKAFETSWFQDNAIMTRYICLTLLVCLVYLMNMVFIVQPSLSLIASLSFLGTGENKIRTMGTINDQCLKILWLAHISTV